MKMHFQDFNNDEEKVRQIARRLISDYPIHGFPIVFQEAQGIGLPVEKTRHELASLLWELNKIYESASRRAVTNIRPDFNHFEEFPVFIGSSWRRTGHYYRYDRRFNPISRIWEVENDNTQWVYIKLSEAKEGEIIFEPIYAQDNKETDSEKKGTESSSPSTL